MSEPGSLVPDDSRHRHVTPRDAELVPHRPEDLALSSLPSMPAVTTDERRRILTEEGFDADAVAEGLKQRTTDLHSRWLPWIWLGLALAISVAVFPRNLFMARPIVNDPRVPGPTNPTTPAAKEIAALMAAGKNDQALERCREVIDAIADEDLQGHAAAADVWHMYLGLLADRSGADEIHDRELLERVQVFAQAAPDDLYAIHYLALMRGRRTLQSMAAVDRDRFSKEILESVGMIANARLNLGASGNDLTAGMEERWRQELMVDLAALYERLWALEDYSFHSERREQAFAELRFTPERSRRGVELQLDLYRRTYKKWPREYLTLGYRFRRDTYIVNGTSRGFQDVAKDIEETEKELAGLPPAGAVKQ